MVICAKLGMVFTCCAPKELFPEEELVNECLKISESTGAKIFLTEDIMEGTRNADAIYTDVWVSMGEATELWQKRIELLSPYPVTMDVMRNANPNAIFLHCTIGKEIYDKYGIKEMEVTDEVFESSHSRVFEEAENRMHTIKAVMYETLRNE